MRLQKQINLKDKARGALRSLSVRAARKCMLQSEYLEEREKILASLPEFPRTLRRDVREFENGYHLAVRDRELVFLYLVDGEFFRTHHETRLPSLRCWDALPRERYSSMPSGLYWINDGNPKLYFSGSQS